ncbi:hypothetical protein [Leptospira weilii]|nr:hypothetical protein [Leptospira weilii]OMI16710.1 hypothetical protein BUQ74_14050 [Leptospira weilii serovar Heyan]
MIKSRYNIIANFRIEEGKLYNLFYMGITMKGKFDRFGLTVYGIQGIVPKVINPLLGLDLYSFTVLERNYFIHLFRFLRGDFAIKNFIKK